MFNIPDGTTKILDCDNLGVKFVTASYGSPTCTAQDVQPYLDSYNKKIFLKSSSDAFGGLCPSGGNTLIGRYECVSNVSKIFMYWHVCLTEPANSVCIIVFYIVKIRFELGCCSTRGHFSVDVRSRDNHINHPKP